MAQGMTVLTALKLISHFTCEECKADAEVACPRNCDAVCVECGAQLCAHHLVRHLQEVHCISIDWRGALKEEAVAEVGGEA